MSIFLKILRVALAALFAGITAGVLFLAGAYLYLGPRLPSVESLKNVHFQVPLRVYTGDGKLMAEFGERRRLPVKLDQVPPLMIDAFLSAEDSRFYEHPGISYRGLLRAAWVLLTTGHKEQGGSTITMQVARNFFLSSEKTYTRKLKEIFLALRIERDLSKKEILDLYLNKIYLGNRAYGVGAAAQVYYGTDLRHLTLAQIAMIAGLPKAPSQDNPIADPQRAQERRAYVLARMRDLGYITQAQYREALAEPVTTTLHALTIQVHAPYVAEMVREYMVEHYGKQAYTGGYSVYTTLNGRLQRAANVALRQDLIAYDTRHGYRGPERHVDLATLNGQKAWDALLANDTPVGGLIPGLVTAVQAQSASVYVGNGQTLQIPWQGLSWARRYINDNAVGPAPRTAAQILKPGDVIRLQRLPAGGWRLAEVPAAQGALVSLRPKDGAILALVGGFDYYRSNFNRVTQAQRQPGSSFKPFIYSAALKKGFTASSLINDAPLVFESTGVASIWRPENYTRRFYGPTPLRVALAHSRNLVSIRLLRDIGVGYAIDYVTRFGFRKSQLPRNLSLVLGSASVTPLEMARGYAAFANGGFLVNPYFIERIEDANGKLLYQANPPVACTQCTPQNPENTAAAPLLQKTAVTAPATGSAAPPTPVLAPRVISPQNDYIMTSMMQSVIREGTGQGALVLNRSDLAGKTGTTNDQRDAWFCGYNHDIATVTWVGFDQVRSLGHAETGARAALPMWIAYMRAALQGMAQEPVPRPPGIVTVRIDPDTGLPTGADNPHAMFEIFSVNHMPQQPTTAGQTGGQNTGSGNIPEQLFY